MPSSTNNYQHFTLPLLQWHFEENNRRLPWKNTGDPYKIWLSEIILQQTRAEQGTPYYERFVTQYPDIDSLAAAPDDEVFRLWQGLGYYNRCRNLLYTARELSRHNKGAFPDTYEGIRALKGIGDYTAAAIASFAFGLPHAVVDGNVYRLLSRYFGIATPIDSTEGKKQFQRLADSLLEPAQPGAYNQAIMDFGSLVCKPRTPNCPECPLSSQCIAYQQELIQVLPVKNKKIAVKERHFHYFILQTDDSVYIQQRTGKDIWQGLYEFHLVEWDGAIADSPFWQSLQSFSSDLPRAVFSNRQRLTHQLIISHFYPVPMASFPEKMLHGIWIPKISIKNYAFPKTILSFLNRKKYF